MTNPELLNLSPSELRANPWNANHLSPENEAKLDASLRRLKTFKTITVRQVKDVPGYEILGGKHRWESAMRVGLQVVPCLNVGFVDDATAKEITLADNARYGTDDAVQLAQIYADLEIDSLEGFLPIGETDIQQIFDASNIALDALDIDENFDKDVTLPDPAQDDVEEKPARVAKTHTQLRFKVTNADAEKITRLILQTRKEQGFDTEDDLTNAGDALVHLLLAAKDKSTLTLAFDAKPALQEVEDMLARLDEIDATDGVAN